LVLVLLVLLLRATGTGTRSVVVGMNVDMDSTRAVSRSEAIDAASCLRLMLGHHVWVARKRRRGLQVFPFGARPSFLGSYEVHIKMDPTSRRERRPPDRAARRQCWAMLL
jgi:hypothetical protein